MYFCIFVFPYSCISVFLHFCISIFVHFRIPAFLCFCISIYISMSLYLFRISVLLHFRISRPITHTPIICQGSEDIIQRLSEGGFLLSAVYCCGSTNRRGRVGRKVEMGRKKKRM
jgi:hypothetical protein